MEQKIKKNVMMCQGHDRAMLDARFLSSS